MSLSLAEATSMQECYFDSGKVHEYAMSKGMLDPLPKVDSPEGPGRGDDPRAPDCSREDLKPDQPTPIFVRVPYGLRRSPLEMSQIQTNKAREHYEKDPGRVAPPEGVRQDEVAGKAGLPIPEGCSSTTALVGQDGQSGSGDG
jgi:hypothetical protein